MPVLAIIQWAPPRSNHQPPATPPTPRTHRFEGADEAWQIIHAGPEPLTSQFSVSYGLVLNLLSVNTLEQVRPRGQGGGLGWAGLGCVAGYVPRVIDKTDCWCAHGPCRCKNAVKGWSRSLHLACRVTRASPICTHLLLRATGSRVRVSLLRQLPGYGGQLAA